MGIGLKIFTLFFLVFVNSVLTQRVPRLSSHSEWRALLKLRSSLGIRAKDWHRKTNPCLNWTGIECQNGRVSQINLSGLRRTRAGKLNPRFSIESLPNFTSLSSFNSSGFLLPGPIPEWLGQSLSNLHVLDLSSCSIYGSIPSSIGGLSRLKFLHLSDNSLTGLVPPALGSLLSLLVLDLSSNRLTGRVPSELSALRKLTKLDLSSNYLSGGIPVGFSLFSSLEFLKLSNNSLDGSIPAQLGNLYNLSVLDLGYNSFSGSSFDALFSDLSQLEHVNLCSNYFSGEVLDHLWALPHLRLLDLSGNNFTGTFPNVTKHSFNLSNAVFNLSNNLFYGELFSGVSEFQLIDLSSNYFQGLAPNDTRSNINVTNNCLSSVQRQRNPETCSKFYAERGRSFDNESMMPPSTKTTESRKRLTYTMVGLFGGLGFIILLSAGLLLLIKMSRRHSRNGRKRDERPVEGQGNDPPLKGNIDFSGLGESFTYKQILQATSNFSDENLIKHGHSGDIFLGIFEDGHKVVIKKVDLSLLGEETYMSELDLLGKTTHPRLVQLVGHCLENENEKFLVYKYMPNGDLSNSFYRSSNSGDESLQSLDWITRLKIAIQTAEALTYLHHEFTPPLVHRDIQASSIFLDEKYDVRLGSLSEVCAQGGDNHKNVIARFLHMPQTSRRHSSGSSPSAICAHDIHCFGKLLLEIITGRLGITAPNDDHANKWLITNLLSISVHDKELVLKIIDRSLIIDEDLLEEVWSVAIVAKSCLNPKPSRRPSMRHVLKALENPFKVVREENFNSEKVRITSSRNSWTAALFGSWQNSSSGSSNSQKNREIIGGLKQAERTGSRSSGTVNDHSSSHKRTSSDVFPEPVDMQDVESG